MLHLEGNVPSDRQGRSLNKKLLVPVSDEETLSSNDETAAVAASILISLSSHHYLQAQLLSYPWTNSVIFSGSLIFQFRSYLQ